MSVANFKELKSHKGHKLEIVIYGDDENCALECIDCQEVLLDFNNEDEA